MRLTQKVERLHYLEHFLVNKQTGDTEDTTASINAVIHSFEPLVRKSIAAHLSKHPVSDTPEELSVSIKKSLIEYLLNSKNEVATSLYLTLYQQILKTLAAIAADRSPIKVPVRELRHLKRTRNLALTFRLNPENLDDLLLTQLLELINYHQPKPLSQPQMNDLFAVVRPYLVTERPNSPLLKRSLAQMFYFDDEKAKHLLQNWVRISGKIKRALQYETNSGLDTQVGAHPILDWITKWITNEPQWSDALKAAVTEYFQNSDTSFDQLEKKHKIAAYAILNAVKKTVTAVQEAFRDVRE